MMSLPASLLVTVLLTIVCPSTESAVVVNLKEASLTVVEGEQFLIHVQISSAAVSDVIVVVSVSEDTDDFIGSSQVGQFGPGDTRDVMITFTARDDMIPEIDEVYLLKLRVVRGSATVGGQASVPVTISANDDAFGVFSFAQISPIDTEEQRITTPLPLTVTRSQGLFGNITIKYRVTGSGPAIPGLDISPAQGSITFTEGQNSKQIELEINADEEAESEEVFTVTISSTIPGVSFDVTKAQIWIKANDAPLRFAQSNIRVLEGPGNKFIEVQVYRGLSADGTIIEGPSNSPATVDYNIIPNTASMGQDFIAANGSLGFGVGIRRNTILVQILEDIQPELQESFTILLLNPSGEVVLKDPARVNVIITGSDDPNGILTIKYNSLGTSVIARVNEDTVDHVTFSITRSGGAFGQVTVEWELSRNDSNSDFIINDLGPARGVAIFADKQTEVDVTLTVIQDSVPEETLHFIVRLLANSVTGGAKVQDPIQGSIILEDNDDAYGVIMFGHRTKQTLVTDVIPRLLHLEFTRQGGYHGDVSIEYTISYNGTTDISEILNKVNPLTALLQNGQSLVTVEMPISTDAFLEVGVNFQVTITRTSLQTAPAYGAYNSPRLGVFTSAVVTVTADAANGEIGFSKIGAVYIDEPSYGPTQISLKLLREGTNGRARITWQLLDQGGSAVMATDEDIQPITGIVVMNSGMAEAEIVLDILPDDDPEIDETFSVSITSVEPSDTQRIRPGAGSVTLVIRANDNPGGVFQFSPLMRETYELLEEGNPLEVIIQRTGGALLPQKVEYYISPNGEHEFYGATNVITFGTGDSVVKSTVVAKGDGEPELAETFTLQLRSYGDSLATIGERSSIKVTIAANDDPYGVVQFLSDQPIVHLIESKDARTEFVQIPLERIAGTFGSLTIHWSVISTGQGMADLEPQSGSVTFPPVQTLGHIAISSVADEVSEGDESFTIQLLSPTGISPGRLGNFATAVVIIEANDYPVHFKEPLSIRTREPGIATVTVVKEGPTTSVAMVKYRTMDETAISADGDYASVMSGQLIFEIGQSEAIISFTVMEDDFPENDETFVVSLYDPQGDILISSQGNTTVVIVANDDASGIFSLAPASGGYSVQEGQSVQISVQRARGSFGQSHVLWEILDSATRLPLSEGTEFIHTRGIVTFLPGEVTQTFAITASADGVPELSEEFILVIYNVTGGVPDSPGKLFHQNTEGIIQILQSDDPYGLFAFSVSSQKLTVSEDHYPGMDNITMATFFVIRRQGTSGRVQVLWEVYTVDSLFPPVLDLFLAGSPSASVREAPELRRPATGTFVYEFNGARDCVVTIPQESQPVLEDQSGGFTITAWVMPFSSTNGLLLAKTSPDGATYYYGVRLQTTQVTSTLEFRYSSGATFISNQIVTVLTMANMEDNKWHFIIVIVTHNHVEFLIDGTLVGRRSLYNEKFDGPGQMTVGASPKQEESFIGRIQDIRVYMAALTDRAIEELYLTSAKSQITPVSGYVYFGDGQTNGQMILTSVQDTIAEPDEILLVHILATDGKARVDVLTGTAHLNVLRSDNANGLFGFLGECYPKVSSSESMPIHCLVTRTQGDYGSVTVGWAVLQGPAPGLALAADDFLSVTGNIEFLEGERNKTIILTISDDAVPELNETFHVVLINVTSHDATPASTDTSGASINPLMNSRSLVIGENDSPYGLMQFSNQGTPPTAIDPVIKPSASQTKFSTEETIGTLSLLVVRAQGLMGYISVEWRTEDVTATSSGLAPDYMASAGRIQLSPGQRYTIINITIFDNDVPELEKSFLVKLINPNGGAVVGPGSNAEVVIGYSDGAYGIFEFADTSLNLIGQELGDMDYTPVSLKIMRLRGTLGAVTVFWRITGNSDNDLITTSGIVLFTDGQRDASLQIRIRGDTAPELDEHFEIQLINISMGDLGSVSRRTSVLTIMANDDPYGVFFIPTSQRPVRVDEGFRNASILIRRVGGGHGIVDVEYKTLDITETYPFLPGTLARADHSDFVPIQGSVRFASGQTEAFLHVTILDDFDPESDEHVFVHLTRVRLIQGEQLRQVAESPRFGRESDRFGQLVIVSNDNAFGVLELSSLHVIMEENVTMPHLTIRRLGGTFGEITVRFQVIDGTARNGLDYTILSDEVTFMPGERSNQIPLEIIDDNLPELAETFTVQLLNVISGGAILGNITSAMVTIEPSDDPSGIFEFSGSGVSIEEPDSIPRNVIVSIVRQGGSMGVVTVYWEARVRGELATSDIKPLSGSVFFVSNEGSREVNIEVLPDDIPEDTENFDLVLTRTDKGGRLGDHSVFRITIKPNDKPYGTIQFMLSRYTLTEQDVDSVQDVTIQRLGGTYRDIRIYYQTIEIDIAQEAERISGDVMSYFNKPLRGKLQRDGIKVDISETADPLNSCAMVCLRIEGCASFTYNPTIADSRCIWYPLSDVSGVVRDSSSQYFVKQPEMVRDLREHLALALDDFKATESYVIMQAGMTSIDIPVQVNGDNVPELDEKFMVTLTRIMLESSTLLEQENRPIFGLRMSAEVVIETNDHAYGEFYIFGQGPEVVDNGRIVYVEEQDSLAVELIVERRGGNVGVVSVSWSVNASLTTASLGKDYSADGAVISFNDRESTRIITISLLDDTIPENDESIAIQLTDPTGGADLSENNIAIVVISANDEVAGRFTVEPLSNIVEEGSVLSVNVTRTQPGLGTVHVQWKITGMSQTNPTHGFKAINGTVLFLPGELVVPIMLEGILDETPELNEEYEFLLTSIVTDGIRPTGHAIIDPVFSSSLITVLASNNPHGIFNFASTSLHNQIAEGESTLLVLIDRKFGSIGKVRVFFTIIADQDIISDYDVEAAAENDDFIISSNFVEFPDGSSSEPIRIHIREDDIPEIDEMFILNLTHVVLLDDPSPVIPPKIGAKNTESRVTIEANDGTKGVLVFQANHSRMGVEERNTTIYLNLIRTQGAFGEVSVFCYSQSVTEGAALDIDYKFPPQTVTFQPGQATKLVELEILDDASPEPDEMFELILANPEGGLVLGTPSKAQITILASDNANGFVTFELDDDITLMEPKGDNLSDSIAQFSLSRGPGFYGVVHVPFTVTANDGLPVSDLTPASGYVTFKDMQTSAILKLHALSDNLPEVEEVFTVTLDTPDGGAQLGHIIQRTLVIRESDAPYGLMQIYVAGTRNTAIDVEETVGLVHFDIVRSQGLLGSITIDVSARSESAMAVGNSSSLSLAPSVNVSGGNIQSWHGFAVAGTPYIIKLTAGRTGEMLSSIGSNGAATLEPDHRTHSVLYAWKEGLVPIQTVETDGATSAASFSLEGVTYLLVANGGITSRRGAKSRLYRVDNKGRLTVIQDLNTVGAADLEVFTHGTNTFAIFANSVNSAGQTTLDSPVFLWDSDHQLFVTTPWQMLPLKGPRGLATFRIAGKLYLAIANYYNSADNQYEVESVLFHLETNNKFTLLQTFPTHGAIDVGHVAYGGDHMLIFGNSRRNVIDDVPMTSSVYLWNVGKGRFMRQQEILTDGIRVIEAFTGPDNRAYVAFANEYANSTIAMWDEHQKEFTNVWSGSQALNFQLISKQLPNEAILMALTNTNPAAKSGTLIYQATMVRDSDFEARAVTLAFQEGKNRAHFSVMVKNDRIPEDTERFYVALSNPTGGAEIGPNQRVNVNILSNDDAHGIIEFADDSLTVTGLETPGSDSGVQLNVIRYRGYFGHVIVSWQASGEQSEHDLSPLSGSVEFSTGQTVATINFVVHDDILPELREITQIELLDIVDKGTTLSARGAMIGKKNIATIVVPANDSPHGVVSWRPASTSVIEPEGTDMAITLELIREQGTMGAIQISFITEIDESIPATNRAISGEDYVATQNSVSMAENVTTATITVNILQDALPEQSESFLVVINSVQLLGSAPRPGAQPSIKQPGGIATVTIEENDDARGVIQFDVTTSVEGRVDTYEELSMNHTLSLRLSRIIGLFGSLTITWQTDHIDTTVHDIWPISGTVKFESGQSNGFIHITILDDVLTEDMELFDVKLVSISGGALIGFPSTVRVAVLQNDSPTGLFGFTDTIVKVRESTTIDDIEGQVNLVILRQFGLEGVVNLQWRLSAEAQTDFQEPMYGVVTFSPLETRKSITLQTRPDVILEGEEKFIVSITSVDNDADISSVHGDATVIIFPDPGANGIIEVQSEYRSVLIGEVGESDPEYSGQTEILLTRGVGIFGEVMVYWAITPRDTTAFAQLDGVVSFMNLQQNATVILQSKDDGRPELLTTYTFQLTSATGGAGIAPQLTDHTASIVFVASDYPHGLFEFGTAQDIIVSEDLRILTLPVRRKLGSVGRVIIGYTTTDLTATAYEDFVLLTTGPGITDVGLIFESGQDRVDIRIQITQDDIPEGPELFFVNLTSVTLLSPEDADFHVVNGLQRDMPPAIGQTHVKKVIIDKNDNAEGVIEFAEDAMEITVKEELKFAFVPVIRHGGSYSLVTAKYTLRNLSATADIDYVNSNGHVLFADGMASTTINVTLRDDLEREFSEKFKVILTETTGGALLGARTSATVTIAKSDYPNGKFVFTNAETILVSNPETDITQVLTIERTDGLLGRQTLRWRIMGPNNPGTTLEDTSDIAYLVGDRETTSGSLQWDDGEGGRKVFTLKIKARSGWEIGKSFVLEIYEISGFPRDIGDGETASPGRSVMLTVQKFGDPNGVVRFYGIAQSARVIEEPDGSASAQIIFPVIRRSGTGVLGNIKVFWELYSEDEREDDILPKSGNIIIQDGRHSSDIILQVLPDDIPELTESFILKLIRVEGGAEIDTTFNTSTFDIRYNDDPHGIFGVTATDQTVYVNPSTLQRSVFIDITREAGAFGKAIVFYFLEYDKSQVNVEVSESSSSLTFPSGERSITKLVPIHGDGFLDTGSTFTLSLTEVKSLDSEVTILPRLDPLRTQAKITVPPMAGNCEVGFKVKVISVDEETGIAELTLVRRGLYGTLSVSWQSGPALSSLPPGFSMGVIVPNADSISIPHGVVEATVTVQLTGKLGTPELFMAHLPKTPITTVVGGARLRRDSTQVDIEPSGVVRFAMDSRAITASELSGQISVTVERVYGSLGKIQVKFELRDINATSGLDYDLPVSDSITLENGQTSAGLDIKIIQDSIPETPEMFSITLIQVIKFPITVKRSPSPRLSSLYNQSIVTIKDSDDPYGILSLEPQTITIQEMYRRVDLAVIRSGGAYGSISVTVRTVGGGETWSSQIALQAKNGTSQNIGEALGSRTESETPAGGQDYDILDTVVHFQSGERKRNIQVVILDDNLPEPTETMFVYLTLPMGGARIARGDEDGSKMGFASIVIAANDISNGLIGFAVESLNVAADEDNDPVLRLKLDREMAFFGPVKVFWKIKKSTSSSDIEDEALKSQLTSTAGSVTCASLSPSCYIDVIIKQDEVPEEEDSFVVILTHVGNDALLNNRSAVARVTMRSSDFVRGLVQFEDNSRIMYVDKDASFVQLRVRRLMGMSYHVEVSFRSISAVAIESQYDISIYPAVSGEDYTPTTGKLVFNPDSQASQIIHVNLTPLLTRSQLYPKQFMVELMLPTNGASLNMNQYQAMVRIVYQADLPIWQAVTQQQQHSLDDVSISQTIAVLDALTQTSLTEEQLILVKGMLGNVTAEAERRQFPGTILNSALRIFCNLNDITHNDATRGNSALSLLLERFVFAILTSVPCPNSEATELISYECSTVKVSVGRWFLTEIKGYQYKAQQDDYLRVPKIIPGTPTQSTDQCEDLQFIEYKNSQWFMAKGSSTSDVLNNKVISFSIRNRQSGFSESPVLYRVHTPDRQIAPRKAQCVYYDLTNDRWDSSADVCKVTNSQDLFLGDYVDCLCKHLSNYAVKAKVSEPGIVGYASWFYIVCFISLGCMALAILAHHICNLTATFSASLLMHMFFACMATQICYVVAAYLSPHALLVSNLDEDNHRCIVMGLFMHYFFIAQFSWMMTQAINLWKILVLNDEHTDRKYVLFFLTGWGLPAIIVIIFYIITFCLYKYVYSMPSEFIYGDVNNNGEICFVANQFAGLGGVIIPALLMVVIAGIVFVQAYQVYAQWQSYDDVYRGRYNSGEVRSLLVLWSLILITWVWGGLHLVYGQFWMLVVFCIFNSAQALYVVIGYTVLRIQWLPCMGPLKATYTLDIPPLEGGPSPYHHLPPHYSPGLKGSRASLLNENWERNSLTPSGMMKVKRAMPLSGNVYTIPSNMSSPPQTGADESQDFDDLIYALKTGSLRSRNDHDFDNSSETSSKRDGSYELRRISITDTHL